MTLERFDALRAIALERKLTRAEVTELFEEMKRRDRERRIAIEISSCHYNDGPCSDCENACDAIDPAWRKDPWSDGIAEDVAG
ncbi:MAG TPA: hypothetical protein VF765_31170 [Polyangiaceae bacterium]